MGKFNSLLKAKPLIKSSEKVQLIESKPKYYVEEDGIEFYPSATLKRELSFKQCFAFVVGGLVGSGVFISPSLVAGRTPNPFVALLVWFLAGTISVLGSFCYCELVAVIRKTGSTYIFVYEAYGSFAGFFLLWTVVIVLLPCVSNVMILIIGNYACSPFFDDHTSDEFHWASRIVGLVFFYLSTFVSCYGVQKTGTLQIFFNALQMIIILVLISLGIYHLSSTGDFKNFASKNFFNNTIDGVLEDFPSLGTALFNALYCFDGWYMIAFFVEEIVNPKKNIPILASTSLPFVTIVYIIVNLACLTSLTHEEMASSVVVFSHVFEEVAGKKFSYVVPFFVVVSTFSALLGFLYQNSRFIMSAAREGQFPLVFSLIHSEKRTPIPATLFITLTGTITTLLCQRLETLIQVYNVAIWIEYSLAFTTVLYFRYKFPDIERSFRVWIVIPVIMLAISLWLIIMVVCEMPNRAIILAIIFVCGLPVYYICLRKNWMDWMKLETICKKIVSSTNLVYCDVNTDK